VRATERRAQRVGTASKLDDFRAPEGPPGAGETERGKAGHSAPKGVRPGLRPGGVPRISGNTSGEEGELSPHLGSARALAITGVASGTVVMKIPGAKAAGKTLVEPA
jgi:hypothetical protein